MSERSTLHASFVIEHVYAASRARVFSAWAEPVAKVRWFVGKWEWKEAGHEFDFRVGGRERLRVASPGGPVYVFDCLYQDIVPDLRIVYTYDMHTDDARVSVSLATVELEPARGGTRLTFTEHVVFLDGHDNAAARKQRTRAWLDNLDGALRFEELGAVTACG